MVFDVFNTMKVIPIFVMAQRGTMLWPFSRVNVLKYVLLDPMSSPQPKSMYKRSPIWTISLTEHI